MKNNPTKRLILETAAQLFQKQGYHGTGINQIIEVSGTPKGSLYYHFPNGKEQIAQEAIKLVKEHIVEQTKLDLQQDKDASEAFRRHILNIADFYDSDNDTEWLKIGTLASETAATHEELRSTCELAFKEWQGLYVDALISRGYSEKVAMTLAITINALLEGATTISLIAGNGDTLRIIAEQIPILLHRENLVQEDNHI
ncbi:TetR/AcrR family transcriptional repressor of lmrAB and yxaGH operons [Rossellomorea marisflavi]